MHTHHPSSSLPAPGPRVIGRAACGAAALLFGLVLALLLSPGPATAQQRPSVAQSCTLGIDCCVVGQSLGQPHQYAVACDGEAQSAAVAAASAGYPIIVYGPTTLDWCAAWMANANVPGWDDRGQPRPNLPTPPRPDSSCTLGVNCCYIGATWEEPPRYAMAHDGQVHTGNFALHDHGYHNILHGPVSASACFAWWNHNIAARGLGPQMGPAGGQAQFLPSPGGGQGPSGPAGPRGGGAAAAGVVQSLSTQAWVRAPQFAGALSGAAQGLLVGGGTWTNGRLRNNVYDGNKVSSRDTYDLSGGGDIYMAFMVDGGGKYMAFYPRLFTGVGGLHMSTHNSWANSVVVPDRVWLFGHLRVERDGSFTHTVARNGYDDHGGQVIYRNSGRLAATRGHLEFQFGDNYAGTAASLLIGEAWVYAGGGGGGMSQGSRLGAGASCTTSEQCASSICLLGVCAPPNR